MKPVVLINSFTPKPGKLDEFIALQTSAVQNFGGSIPGWRGSRLHRSLDGKTAVMMTLFDSVDDHKRWLESEAFARHREKVLQLVEKAEPGYYEAVYEAGHLEI